MIKKFIASKVAMPFFDLSKGMSVAKYYHLYKKTLDWSQEQIQDFQLQKLKKLVQYAARDIPFYQKKFSQYGVSADTLKGLEDLKKFPCLMRRDIQDQLPDLTPANADLNGVHKGCSSGSTGKPISYYIGKASQSAGRAAMYTGWHLTGWEPGIKGIHIWGNPTVVKEKWSKPSSKLKDILFNHYKYPAYKLTEKKEFLHLVAQIKKEKYQCIEGYTTAIYLLADYIAQNNIEMAQCQMVLTTAETLQDFQRGVIRENLGPIYDFYGCSEIEGIANECRFCGNYHVMDPRVIVELDDQAVNLDGSRPIIVTELDNTVMPFIRYRIGDLAIPAHNIDCPVNFTALTSISGRTSDIIAVPGGGNLVVASFFGAALLKKLEKKITQYQVEKISPDKIILNLAVSNQYKKADETLINQYLSHYLGGKMHWEIQIKDQIPVSKNGKFKLLVDRTQNPGKIIN